MASIGSGVILMGIVVVIGSLFCLAYADDDEIYPGGMVITKFNSSEIGTMQNSQKFNSSEIGTMQNSKKFNSSEIGTMQNSKKFNSSEIGTMQDATKFNSSMIGTMQNTVSNIPLPPGVTV